MDTLDCQDCGNVLTELTPYEASLVAERPHDFVVYCPTCRRLRCPTQ